MRDHQRVQPAVPPANVRAAPGHLHEECVWRLGPGCTQVTHLIVSCGIRLRLALHLPCSCQLGFYHPDAVGIRATSVAMLLWWFRTDHAAVRRGLSTTVTWFTSPIVLGGLGILLLFCIVVLQSRVAKFRRDVHRLKEDFTAYRRDMKEKASAAP